jgi:hypothetical protein
MPFTEADQNRLREKARYHLTRQAKGILSLAGKLAKEGMKEVAKELSAGAKDVEAGNKAGALGHLETAKEGAEEAGDPTAAKKIEAEERSLESQPW